MKKIIVQFCILVSLLSSYTLPLTALNEDVWKPTNYIWNLGLALMCDVKPHDIPYFNFEESNYENIKEGDIVWVKSGLLQYFYKQILPKVKNNFILVINDGTETFPIIHSQYFPVHQLINNEKIIHIFAHNYDYETQHKKISPIPLGIDFHTMAYKNEKHGEKALPLEQEAELKDLLETAQSTHLRKKLAFVDFQHNDTIRYGSMQRYLKLGEDRTTIFEYLKTTGLIDYSDPLKRIDLWRKKIEYAFSISPHGNGLDCHRTWEDLLLGCIVIVKTSSLDPLYEGLPVVIVQDWSELTEENFDYWIEKYRDAFDNPAYREKLSYLYWWNRIQEKAQPFK